MMIINIAVKKPFAPNSWINKEGQSKGGKKRDEEKDTPNVTTVLRGTNGETLPANNKQGLNHLYSNL